MRGARGRDRARITDSRASTAQVSPVGPRCYAPGGWHPEASEPASHRGLTGLTPSVRLGGRGEDFSLRPSGPRGRAPGPKGCRSMAGLTPWGLDPEGQLKARSRAACLGRTQASRDLELAELRTNEIGKLPRQVRTHRPADLRPPPAPEARRGTLQRGLRLHLE